MINREDMLTWLNGRAPNILVYNEGVLEVLWDSGEGISIEDAIERFVKKNKIDFAKEIKE